MGVYIKGMEMPKEERYVDVRIFADGISTMATGEHPFYREMDVIELPPHGRLIDADALLKKSDDGDDVMFIWALKDAPTIIESEE